MKAADRRKAIVNLLLSSNEAISGGKLSEEFGVSRQIIVQDITVLKGTGYDILSTHNGYIIQKNCPENAESYIIRCVVTKSDLSTYEDVIRIVYEPLRETDTIVSFVDIGEVETPVAGNTPDMSAVCYTQGCNVSDISWYDVTNGQHLKLNATDKFIENHIYCVDISVYAEELHSFYMVDGYNETLGAVNGERANAYGTHDDKEMTFYYTFAPCESSGDYFKLGDVDCSGEITILDATQIQLHIASLIELRDNQLKLADTDKTGDISIMDATAIQLYIAKLITEF